MTKSHFTDPLDPKKQNTWGTQNTCFSTRVQQSLRKRCLTTTPLSHCATNKLVASTGEILCIFHRTRTPAELKVHVDNTVSAGAYVSVLDESNDTKYHIITKVRFDVSELTTTIHYYGVKKRRLREVICKSLYQFSDIISLVFGEIHSGLMSYDCLYSYS